MGNIVNYVRWRGDLPLTKENLNLLDVLYLSETVYIDLEPLLSPEGEGTLKTCAEKARSENIPLILRMTAGGLSPDGLFATMDTNIRFQDLKISRFREIYDRNRAVQFTAMCVELFPGMTLIVFRGTDDSIAGWKEDFYMAVDRILSQDLACSYLTEILESGPKDQHYLISGHSKGGNLALFASARQDRELLSRVDQIYLLDSPGLCKDVFDLSGLERLSGRILTVTPYYSVIGQLFRDSVFPEIIADSSAEGFIQHDMLSWQIEDMDLVRRSEHHPQSEEVNRLLADWISEVPFDERRTFIDDVFNALLSDGNETISDLLEKGPDGIYSILESFGNSRTKGVTARAAARLPLTAFFGKQIMALANQNIWQVLEYTSILQTIFPLLFGALFTLTSEHFITVSTMVFFLGVLIFHLFMTFRRLYKNHFSLEHSKTDLSLAVFLTVLIASLITRENALFLVGTLVFGSLSLFLGFNRLGILRQEHPSGFYHFIAAYETVMYLLFGFASFFTTQETIFGFCNSIGYLLIIDGLLRLGNMLYRQWLSYKTTGVFSWQKDPIKKP